MNHKELKKIIDEHEALIKRKNEMYGDGNIDKIGAPGILTRIEEKTERLKHLIENNINPEEEPIEDTWKDIAGYAIIGLMVQRGKWKDDE